MTASTPDCGCEITGVILAGGAGTRMQGQAKALLPWRGSRFIDHIVAALQPQVTVLAISTNQRDPYAQLGLPLLADPFATPHGPLAGMLAGLDFARTEWTLFVPGDNPQPSPDLGQRLLDGASTRGVDIAWAFTGSDRHYLCALLRTSLRDNLRAHFGHGDYAVHRWYAKHAHIRVDFSDQPAHFRNINTPAALNDLQSGA
jgi:molybdopterin-guanine dinucleotide biosynthesis protein A